MVFPFFFFFDGEDLNSGFLTCKAGALPLEPHLQSMFCSRYFGDGGGLELPVSASQVAGITDKRHRHLAGFSLYFK
jgi:hypothetical protein